MATNIIDKDYIDFLLSKSFKTYIKHEKSSDKYILSIDFVYNDKELAYATIHYLLFRLRKEKILLTLFNSKENILTVALNIVDRGIKIITTTKSFNLLETSSFIAESPPYDDVIAFVSCKYQKGFEMENVSIEDRELVDNILNRGAIQVYAWQYGNDGLELFPPEYPSF